MTTAKVLGKVTIVDRTVPAGSGIPAVADARIEKLTEFLAGTGDLQIDLVFAQEYTIAPGGGAESFDMDGLTDQFGETVAFADVCAIGVFVDDEATGPCTVGGNLNAFQAFFEGTGDQINIGIGAFFLITDVDGGWQPVASTGDILDIDEIGAAGTKFKVVFLGRSA